jgi:hypothetical protein
MHSGAHQLFYQVQKTVRNPVLLVLRALGLGAASLELSKLVEGVADLPDPAVHFLDQIHDGAARAQDREDCCPSLEVVRGNMVEQLVP